MSSKPYEVHLPTVVVPDGGGCLPVAAPWTGRLHKLLVKRLTGSGPFTARVFNAIAACEGEAVEGGAAVSASSGTSEGDARDVHDILPEQTAVGERVAMFSPEGYPYANLNHSQQSTQDRVYLAIMAETGGNFRVAMT